MNLTQLYDLRTATKQNPNKVISKETFLAVLDQLIGTFAVKDEQTIVQDAIEPPQGAQEPVRSLG